MRGSRWFAGTPRPSPRWAASVLAGVGCAASAFGAAHPAGAPGPAGFEAALCAGLAAEIGIASDRQHFDRDAITVELHVKGGDDARRQTRLRCLTDALRRSGFTVNEGATVDGVRELLAIAINVPEEAASADERVAFAVSACHPHGRAWSHPGYIDFHERDGRWSNDAAKITRFVDGACPVSLGPSALQR